MEKQDYLKRQIDQLGKVLGELLVKITGSGRNLDASETLEIVSQVLDENLELDMEQLLIIPDAQFIEALKRHELLNDFNLEILGDLLARMAIQDSSRRKSLANRALLIYEHLEQSNKTFSFTRNQKMEKARGLLTK